MIRPLLWLPLAALCLTPALAQEASLEKQAQELHKLAGGEWCNMDTGYVPDDAYESWTFKYQSSWSEESDPEEVTLIRMFCMAGAYNINHSYYIYRDYEGLTPIAFASPLVDPQYEDPDDSNSPLLAVPVIGMTSSLTLVNSDFDIDALTITSYAKWRGLGDASSSGTWVFRDGEFVLSRFDVDASYDDEINPETVLDYTTP